MSYKQFIALCGKVKTGECADQKVLSAWNTALKQKQGKERFVVTAARAWGIYNS